MRVKRRVNLEHFFNFFFLPFFLSRFRVDLSVRNVKEVGLDDVSGVALVGVVVRTGLGKAKSGNLLLGVDEASI